jgi:hypothetical protein
MSTPDPLATLLHDESVRLDNVASNTTHHWCSNGHMGHFAALAARLRDAGVEMGLDEQRLVEATLRVHSSWDRNTAESEAHDIAREYAAARPDPSESTRRTDDQ